LTREEIDFILGTVAQYLDRPPTRADILSTFAGIRPADAPLFIVAQLAGAAAATALFRWLRPST